MAGNSQQEQRERWWSKGRICDPIGSGCLGEKREELPRHCFAFEDLLVDSTMTGAIRPSGEQHEQASVQRAQVLG